MSIVSEIKKLVREKGGTPSGNTTAALLDDFLSAGGGGSAGGDDVFLVTMTSPEDHMLRLDKTCQEIVDAYIAGKRVVVDASALAFRDVEMGAYVAYPAQIEYVIYDPNSDPKGSVWVRFYNGYASNNQLDTYTFHQDSSLTDSYDLPTWGN